jgi:hypothetical protein
MGMGMGCEYGCLIVRMEGKSRRRRRKTKGEKYILRVASFGLDRGKYSQARREIGCIIYKRYNQVEERDSFRSFVLLLDS